MDEAGVNETIDYEYGYAHKSERYHADKRGNKGKRLSFVSGWWKGSTIAPLIFEGYCNSELICKWIRQHSGQFLNINERIRVSAFLQGTQANDRMRLSALIEKIVRTIDPHISGQ